MLHDLLASAIGECAAWCDRPSGPGTRRDVAVMADAH
jgi:hypothetical protein